MEKSNTTEGTEKRKRGRPPKKKILSMAVSYEDALLAKLDQKEKDSHIEAYSHLEMHKKLGYPIFRSNEFIQKSRYEMGQEEARIEAYMAAQIRPDDDGSLFYAVDVRDYCAMCGIKYSTAKKKQVLESFKKLVERHFQWKVPGRNVYFGGQWFDSPVYDLDAGRMMARYHSSIWPYIIAKQDLQGGFSVYQRRYVLLMNSKFGYRLYVLALTHLIKKAHVEKIYDAAELAEVINYEPKAFKISEMIRSVIDPALADIMALTDLDVTYYTFSPSGKKAHTHICLVIRRKTSAELVRVESTIKRLRGQCVLPDRSKQLSLPLEGL